MSSEKTRQRVSLRRGAIAASWAVLPLCVIVYVAGALTASRVALVVRVVAFQVPVTLSVIGALVAWRRVRAGSPERMLWGSLAVATTLLFASEAYYSAYQVFVDPAGPPSPSAFDALNLAAAAVFVLLLGAMSRAHQGDWRARAYAWLSMVATAALVCVLEFRFVAIPIASAYGHSRLEAFVWTLYTLVGIVLLLGVYVLLARPRVKRWSPWERCLGVGTTGYGLATFAWPLWSAGTGSGDGPLDLLWSCAYLVGYHLLFMATVYRVTGDASPWEPATPSIRSGRLSRFGPIGVVVPVVSMPALGWILYRSAPGSLDRSLYFSIIAIMTAAIVARTALADWESRALRRSEATDALTGALNRRSFLEKFEAAFESARHGGTPLSLAVFDVDDFARFNVLEGKSSGDAALSAIATALAFPDASPRPIARLGGDEFAVIMAATDKTAAVAAASDICANARKRASAFDRRLTLSCGVAEYPADADSSSELLERADESLYWAKYQGKNRVAAYSADVMRAHTVAERIRTLAERSRLDIVRALAGATDARDPATSYHSRQVAHLASLVCDSIGLDAERSRNVQLAALLHDVGKVGVPDSVLRKRAWLSDRERTVLREHADLGARILEATELAHMAPWVRAHHEAWDGSGYPDGSVGEEIPLEARIIAVCNEFDVMISGGPERGPLSEAASLQEIDLGMGTKFDPRLAEALIEAVGKSHPPGWGDLWPS